MYSNRPVLKEWLKVLWEEKKQWKKKFWHNKKEERTHKIEIWVNKYNRLFSYLQYSELCLTVDAKIKYCMMWF